MSYITSSELRQKFLKFFENKKHKILDSASLIPNDPQLMFTIAGMVPFKPIFWGKMEPTYKRVATSQKCIRTNDIDNVGKTPRHHTFFEMLGNFSFGDYFKKESIEWAWEFLTKELKIPEEKLWPSVYLEDQEAYDIWKEEIKVPVKKIMKFDKSENWWGPAGPSGPCGPCSEIYIDTEYTKKCTDIENCTPECECGRFVEIWNIVFTEYYSDEKGQLTPLNNKNIDTGLGLERTITFLQGKYNNYDSDLFKEIIESIEKTINVTYNESDKTDSSIRVIADHARTVAFVIAEGILPSNEGRGYVLRRIIRRAVRHGNLLGKKEPFLKEVIKAVVDKMGEEYQELKEKNEFINKIVYSEEVKFFETLDFGMDKLKKIMNTSKEKIITGKDSFELYDTYGFPLEIVKEIADEKGFIVDEEEFKNQMENQRKMAREASGNKEYDINNEAYKFVGEKIKITEFLGYETSNINEKLLYIIKNDKLVEEATIEEIVELVFKKTPFYAEKGGQVADKGIIKNDYFEAEVLDVKTVYNEVVAHKVKINKGKVSVNEECFLEIDEFYRNNIKKNHTATHLLHKTLKEVLGEHVKQAGSLVENDRLRFDFTHYESLNSKQILKIEQMVNQQILNAIPVRTEIKDIKETKNMNVVALFEEKYGDKVRIVSVDDFSSEFCGGIHVSNTGEIGPFKIINESSISAGMRRIEAITGYNTLKYFNKIESKINRINELLDSKIDNVEEKLINFINKNKEQEKIRKQMEARIASSNIEKLLINAKLIKGTKIVTGVFESLDKDIHREITDNVLNKIESGIVIIFNKGDKVIFTVKVSKDKIKEFHAGNIAKSIASELGGGGGGRPDFAQAGGKDSKKIDNIIKNIESYI